MSDVRKDPEHRHPITRENYWGIRKVQFVKGPTCYVTIPIDVARILKLKQGDELKLFFDHKKRELTYVCPLKGAEA